MLLHNHPSGDPAPSRQDMKVTDDIKEPEPQKLFVRHVVSSVSKYYMEKLRHEKKERVLLLMLDNKAQLLAIPNELFPKVINPFL